MLSICYQCIAYSRDPCISVTCRYEMISTVILVSTSVIKYIRMHVASFSRIEIISIAFYACTKVYMHYQYIKYRWMCVWY